MVLTNHHVISAPFHRYQQGMIAQIKIALAPEDEIARNILAENEMDYVVTCLANPEFRSDTDENGRQKGFVMRVKAGDVPEFLTPVPGLEQQPMQIFLVE